MELEGHVASSPVPEWSCGGYVYEDALTPTFDYVDLPSPPGSMSKITRYPILRDEPFVIPGGDTVISTLRWLTPEECPEHQERI